MNSDTHPKAYGFQAPGRDFSHSPLPPRPQVHEDTLNRGMLQIERKTFLFSLKENARGRLLRITEDLNGRRNSIIVPATGLREFKALLEEMLEAVRKLPSQDVRPFQD